MQEAGPRDSNDESASFAAGGMLHQWATLLLLRWGLTEMPFSCVRRVERLDSEDLEDADL